MDQNRLLRALPAPDRAALAPLLEKVELLSGQTIEAPGVQTSHALFVESGLAAVIAHSPGRRIGIGVIGCDGMTALDALHYAGQAAHETVVQANGTALRISTEKLQDVMDGSLALRRLLLRYAQFFTVQASQTALTNGRALMEERLARWILMSHDRMKDAVLHVTHEFIALMLGVRRAGITGAIHVLEGKHLIKSRRNQLRVLDRQGLIEITHGAYGICEDEYERLIDSRFRDDVEDPRAAAS